MTLLFTTRLCLDPCHTFSLSLSLSTESKHHVGGWIIHRAIKRLTRISELPKHRPKIICTPEPGLLLLFHSAVDIPNAKLFRPRLFTRSQPGAEPANPPSPHSSPPSSSSSNSVQSDPNERITRNYDIVRNKFRENLSLIVRIIHRFNLLSADFD